MNRSEFENWLKDQVEETAFSPGDKDWVRMKNALDQQASSRKNIAFFFPAFKYAAAALLLMVMTIGTGYFFYHQDEKRNAAKVHNGEPVITSREETSGPRPAQMEVAVQAIPESRGGEHVKPVRKGNQQPALIEPLLPPAGKEVVTTPGQLAGVSAQEPDGEAEKETPESREVIQPSSAAPVIAMEEPLPRHWLTQDASSFRQHPGYVGIAGSVGASTAGGARYQLGINGRKELSRTLYIDAVVAVSASSLAYTSHHHFQGVQVISEGASGGGNIPSGSGPDYSVLEMNTDVQAQYAGQVVSVGVSPALGWKLMPKLHLSAGGYIFHHINHSIRLSNGAEMTTGSLMHNMIPARQEVNPWDLGIRGGAEYQIYSSFSVNAGFRYGLTNYLDNPATVFRNTGFDIGFRYFIGASGR